MRRALAIVALCAACIQRPPNLPPGDQFYYPTGLHHVDAPDRDAGYLYVVSANFDKRYDFGQLTAIDLDTLGLPPIGAAYDGGGVAAITMLGVTKRILLASFANDIAAWPRPGGGERFFIP